MLSLFVVNIFILFLRIFVVNIVSVELIIKLEANLLLRI